MHIARGRIRTITRQRRLIRLPHAGGAPAAVGGLDANWWKRWQYAGVLPTVVMDFANGIYWDGSTTSTDATAFINNGTVTPGSGLLLSNSLTVIAKGAL